MAYACWNIYDRSFLANTGASWCTASQLYPMLHYGSKSLLYQKSAGRRSRDFFWRILSFFCDHAQTLVALLIATVIVLSFDHWPSDIIKDYFTLQCKSSTMFETGKCQGGAYGSVKKRNGGGGGGDPAMPLKLMTLSMAHDVMQGLALRWVELAKHDFSQPDTRIQHKRTKDRV